MGDVRIVCQGVGTTWLIQSSKVHGDSEVPDVIVGFLGIRTEPWARCLAHLLLLHNLLLDHLLKLISYVRLRNIFRICADRCLPALANNFHHLLLLEFILAHLTSKHIFGIEVLLASLCVGIVVPATTWWRHLHVTIVFRDIPLGTRYLW